MILATPQSKILSHLSRPSEADVRPGNADFPIVEREVPAPPNPWGITLTFERVEDADLTLAEIAEEQAALTAFEHDFYDRLSARRHRLDMLKIDLEVEENAARATGADGVPV
jgi:hypothetical protein